MGHNPTYRVFPENVNKNRLYAELNNMVEHEDWQEGGHLDPIKWREDMPVFESYESAYSWLENHRGFYDNKAVRFKEAEKTYTDKDDKVLADLYKKDMDAQKRIDELNAPHFVGAKSAYIGCKKCGSKIANEYLRGNYCPVCGADLRPQTSLDLLAKAQEKRKEILKKIRERREYLEKKNGKYTVKWLVYFDYHT